MEDILEHERGLARLIHQGLMDLDKVTVLGPQDTEKYTGVVSFNIKDLDPAEVGMILDNRYGIMVRTGLHCAPLAHKMLGTYAVGSVRASVGPFSTEDEVNALIQAIKEISKGRS